MSKQVEKLGKNFSVSEDVFEGIGSRDIVSLQERVGIIYGC